MLGPFAEGIESVQCLTDPRPLASQTTEVGLSAALRTQAA